MIKKGLVLFLESNQSLEMTASENEDIDLDVLHKARIKFIEEIKLLLISRLRCQVITRNCSIPC